MFANIMLDILSADRFVCMMASLSSSIRQLWFYIRWLYYQYSIHLAVSAMDPWETILVSILFEPASNQLIVWCSETDLTAGT